jgi:S1-C subfamily serine protease
VKYSLLLASSTALLFSTPAVNAEEILPSAENHRQVVAIAKQATVMLVEANPEKSLAKRGSGVIIQKQGNLYTIITNRHVVCEFRRANINHEQCSMPNSYNLITVDGQKYSINNKSIQLLPGDLDLAIIKFQSNQNYAVGKLANSDSAPIGTQIHTAGYDATTLKFTDDDGSVMANSSHVNNLSDKNGYGIIYNAYTNKGMSGSGIWNSQGQIVAIHGQGLRYEIGTLRWLEMRDSELDKVGDKYGWNIGIPINHFIK